ncbi:uncharacterized protein MYCGRDRAFT_106620 [Zymoseptoria tritici IPO323]|uniref:Uncharacterized protein n=1 Tax=Zymoseptoria tritici (strain CBS 115943 / IPO323) TaxID=336722 RepID=F9XQY9_ZYMTI|nr:uncharacterized protein MYCGRDRAFT_106620 [Zymoseptoria tritici IPO323]EGP82338.1 hypothetical protein MYCGRDRAFT_106620 [Zymoseptoria tritici IPO323]
MTIHNGFSFDLFDQSARRTVLFQDGERYWAYRPLYDRMCAGQARGTVAFSDLRPLPCSLRRPRQEVQARILRLPRRWTSAPKQQRAPRNKSP